MVVKDEHDRILITHEAASENGEDAKQFLQRLKDRGLKVTAAFSDYSHSFTEAIKAVYPHARFQADHFHTVKNVWGHLKKSLFSYRRQVKASGEAQQDEACIALAKKLWVCPTFYTPRNSTRWGPFPIKSATSQERYFIA
jgi:transposase-like protein